MVRRPRCGGPSAHYGVDRPRARRRSWRRRCCGSSSPSSAATTQLPVVHDAARRARRRPTATTTSPLRETLDRLIDAHPPALPGVASLARTVRHRRFDRPHVDRAAGRGLVDDARRSPTGLAGPTVDPDRIDELVACPLPLVPILAEDGLLAGTPTPGRCSRCSPAATTRSASSDRSRTDADGVVRTPSTVHNGRRVHVLAIRAGDGDAGRDAVGRGGRGHRRRRRRRTRPSSTSTSRCRPTGRRDADELSAELADVARARSSCPGRCAASRSSPRTPTRRPTSLTFRRADDDGVRPYWMSAEPDEDSSADDPARFEEDVKFRGLHPMIARRLQMWRLANFEISRLPAAGEVHLFDCVGRENPSDERLVAVAEVRDLTPVRDEHGRAVALPEVESLLVGCLDAIRQALAERPHAAAARVEPGHALRLAAGRPAARRAERDRPPPGAAHRGPRPRAGRRQRAARRARSAASRSRR